MAHLIVEDANLGVVLDTECEDERDALGLIAAGQEQGLVDEFTNIYLDGDVLVANGEFQREVPEDVREEARRTVEFGRSIGFLAPPR